MSPSSDPDHNGEADQLEPIERLAVAYAPERVRNAWSSLLAFDHRLSDAAREGRDPIMVQLRLAWWRDRMAEPAARWPKGEPLLAALASWDGERAALAAIVDGWEARNVGSDGGAALREARIAALLALARIGGETDRAAFDAIARAGAEWLDRAGHATGPAPRLPRTMRPLVILRGMALLPDHASPAVRFLRVLRLGLLGR